MFSISAPDFDEICQATCQQSLRLLVREKTAAEVIDMSDADTVKLRTAIGEVLGGYGIDVKRIVITHISLPIDFVASREAQGLAAVQRAEEQELHALEVLRQADRDERTRRRIAAQREAIELEAANEVRRLERLEARLRDYPAALNGTSRHSASTSPARSPATPGDGAGRTGRRHRRGDADAHAARRWRLGRPNRERPRSRKGPGGWEYVVASVKEIEAGRRAPPMGAWEGLAPGCAAHRSKPQ